MQRAEHENTKVSEQRDRQTFRLGTLPMQSQPSYIMRPGHHVRENDVLNDRSQSAILVWVYN